MSNHKNLKPKHIGEERERERERERLENLAQLFKVESNAIGIKPVYGIDAAIAKYVFFYKIVEKS